MQTRLSTVTWVGINDLYRKMNIGSQLRLLFQHQDLLYQAGARNFLFITVPPLHHAPICTSLQGNGLWLVVEFESRSACNDFSANIETWNSQLQSLADEFGQTHSESSTLVFDTTPIFNQVLDNPKKYGFKDAVEYGKFRSIWYDMGHVGGGMHRILAKHLASFLETPSWKIIVWMTSLGELKSLTTVCRGAFRLCSQPRAGICSAEEERYKEVVNKLSTHQSLWSWRYSLPKWIILLS